MGWLENIERDFRFKCRSCGQENYFSMKSGEFTDAYKGQIQETAHCEECDEAGYLEYLGFETSEPLNITTHRAKELYEKNGRLAYKIGDTYMSKTKYDYMETGQIENKYSAGFKEHLEKEAEKNEQFLQTEKNKRRGITSKASPRFAPRQNTV